MKQDASPGSKHDTGCLGLVHWDDPEGWYGEGGGRRVRDGDHMYKKKNNNKAEIDVFLELSCFFDDPTDVGNLISGSSAFSKTSLSIRKITVHVLLKPGLENFKHDFISM